MKCQHCSFDNRDGVKFCENCGKPLAGPCEHCGASLGLQAKFCGNCGMPTSLAASTPEEKETQKRLATLRQSAPAGLQAKLRAANLQLDDERKSVSILFADVVGSTTIAEKLDPEEWREIISGVHARVSHAVYQFEGTIAQLLGDGVLAFFGAPITHEDDPMRAVRAALKIQEAMTDFARDVAHKTSALSHRIEKLEMRIGIHSGLVVVGKLGDDLHMEYTALGDTVNLASRLQAAAMPGTVLISEATARRVKAAFDLNPLGSITVKGKSQPVNVFQVLNPKTIPASGRGTEEMKAPLIGREQQMQVLQGTLAALVERGGQIVTIIGEAGIGKSRLVEELQKANPSPNFLWLEGRALSNGQTLAFWTIQQLIKSDLGISDGDPEIKLRLAITRRVNELFGERANQVLPLLAHLLETKLEGDGAEQIQMLTGETLKRQTLRALGDYFARLAEIQPTILIFEDLHWADPSTLDVLEMLLPFAERVPLMLVALFRPERDHGCWKIKQKAETDFSHRYTEIVLSPLSAQDSDRLVSELLDTTELPAHLRQVLTERAEGNPFYLEELLRSLIEQGAVVCEDSHWRVTNDLANVSIPDTLQGVLLARIGRLEEDVRHTLQLAAVIGRSFLYRLLEVISNAESQLDGQLTELQRADLIREKSRRPDLEYIFKHALTQEAAYHSLLLKRRREFHRQVGEALERLYSDRSEELAAMMGHHYERAQVRDKAIHYLAMAADHARATFSNAEAITLYRSAIEQVNQAIDETNQPSALRFHAVNLHERLGEVLALIGRSDEARTIFQQALEYADDNLAQARLHRRMGMSWLPQRQLKNALPEYDIAETELGARQETVEWQREWLELQNEKMWAYYWLGNLQAMQKIAEEAEPVLLQYGTPLQRARFFRNLTLTAFRRERYIVSDETLAYARESVSASTESGDQSEICFSTFVLGFSHMWRCEWNIAEKYLQDVLKLAERIEDVERRVLSLTYLTIVYRGRKEIAHFEEYLVRARRTATDAKMLLYVDVAQMNETWLAWRRGNFSEALGKGYAVLSDLTNFPMPFPAEWFARLPLLAIHSTQGQEAQAVENARAMLMPLYARFPSALEKSLQDAVNAWDVSDVETTRMHLNCAIQLAQEIGYL